MVKDRHNDNFIVVSEEYRFPYSKGLMARSLIRAGLPSDDAYRLAKNIQKSVLQDKIKELPRRRLKEITASLIHSEFGEEAAASYQNWKLNEATIFVGDEHQQQPFSRGLLAQSLLAAGLGPELAHCVAEKMAADFWERGIKTISRDKLRSLTYQKILSDFGKEYAEHYLLWRRLKVPEKPLILMFGGATGTGKSSLSVEIAHRLGISRVIATDIIREIMRGMFSRELMPSIHESSYTVWKEFSRPLAEEYDPVLAAFQEQTQRVSVAVNSIIRRSVKENLSIIMEGIHLIPQVFSPELTDKAYVIMILICTMQEEMHRNRFIGRAQDAKLRMAQKYLDNFDSIRKIQDALVAKASEHKVFMIDNVDFDESVGKIVQYLTRCMGELTRTESSIKQSSRET